MKNKTIIIALIIVVLTIGGGISYLLTKDETKWRGYELEEITKDFQSVDFMDRRLIGVRNDGQRDIIVESIKELMNWEKTLGETGFYPVKVSFPPHSSKIFFAKYIAGTGHSSGLFMLDVKTLEHKELTEIGQIYQNYYNNLSIASPDGLKIASLGYDKLYLLILSEDEARVLIEAGENEAFYLADMESDYLWLDNDIIQYPVHSRSSLEQIGIRQISITNRF